jgi:hypothetical protein
MAPDRRHRSPRDWLTPRARRCDERRPERLYAGHREGRAEAYVVTREAVTPLTHRAFRGDTAFDWGTLGAGAVELAFALLFDAGHRRPSRGIVLHLAAGLVAELPAEGFVLSADDVHRCLAQARRDRALARAARRDRWVRALGWADPWPLYPFLLPLLTRPHERRDDATRAPGDRAS